METQVSATRHVYWTAINLGFCVSPKARLSGAHVRSASDSKWELAGWLSDHILDNFSNATSDWMVRIGDISHCRNQLGNWNASMNTQQKKQQFWRAFRCACSLPRNCLDDLFHLSTFHHSPITFLSLSPFSACLPSTFNLFTCSPFTLSPLTFHLFTCSPLTSSLVHPFAFHIFHRSSLKGEWRMNKWKAQTKAAPTHNP